MADRYEHQFECKACGTQMVSCLPAPRCWKCFGPMEDLGPATGEDPHSWVERVEGIAASLGLEDKLCVNSEHRYLDIATLIRTMATKLDDLKVKLGTLREAFVEYQNAHGPGCSVDLIIREAKPPLTEEDIQAKALNDLAERLDTYASDQIAMNRKRYGKRTDIHDRNVRAGTYKSLAAEFRDLAKKLRPK